MPSHVPVNVRRSVLTPLDRAGRARAVERRLAEAIALGVFADGEQLPAESALAAQFGVATVTLREALVELRRRGLVETRRGRSGGSFVRARTTDTRHRALERLKAYSADGLRDLFDHRVALAAASAGLAAQRASDSDLTRLQTSVAAFANARDDADRRRTDVRLHVELPSIARSRRLTTANMDLHAEVGPFLWLVFRGEQAARAAEEHRAIMAAVCARDQGRAASLAAEHAGRELRELIGIRVSMDAPPECTGSAAAVLDAIATAIEDVFAAIAAVDREVLRIHAAASVSGERLHRADLEPLRRLLHVELKQLPIMAGLGMIFAPRTLADEERWIEWLCATDEGSPEPLVTTLDPAASDFYDYEAAEWYQVPRQRGTRWIAGPFVDHSGTDAHIFTLTRPVIDADGVFLGVAGADLTVDSVQAIIGPSLSAMPAKAVLLNHQRRVIAANTGDCLPGTLHAATRDETVTRDPRIPWIVASRP